MTRSSEQRAVSFVAIELRARDAEAAERAAAEAYAAGATGLEERAEEGGGAGRGVMVVLYAPIDRAQRVREAAAVEGVRVGPASPLPEVDWAQRWKRDAKPVVVSPRLVVRPSFERAAPGPGQCVLSIDPAAAFGTGTHESTRLALECIDARAADLSPEDRLLDVGTGTGVLALAALGLGCGGAVALDLDPLAAREAARNAARNGLSGRLRVFAGGVEALAPGAGFAWVVANLLWSEMLPLLAAIATHTRGGGHVILSGLLEAQARTAVAEAARCGLVLEQERRRDDASGVGWAALILRRGSASAPRADPA